MRHGTHFDCMSSPRRINDSAFDCAGRTQETARSMAAPARARSAEGPTLGTFRYHTEWQLHATRCPRSRNGLSVCCSSWLSRTATTIVLFPRSCYKAAAGWLRKVRLRHGNALPGIVPANAPWPILANFGLRPGPPSFERQTGRAPKAPWSPGIDG